MANQIEQGVLKQLRFKRQPAKGTIATNSAGQILRRVTSVFEVKKDIFDSGTEQNSTQQLVSVRHGSRQVTGTYNDLYSPGTHSDLLAALLRRDFAVIAAIAGASITIAGAGPQYTLTRAAGSFLTDGAKIGMVLRLSVGSFNAANLNKNLFIIGLTALVATVLVVNGSALVAEGPIITSTATPPGKVTYAQTVGQTQIYYTIEEWFPSVGASGQSEQNIDCRVANMQFTLPGSGNGSITAAFNGLNQLQTQGAAYFTAPTTESTAEIVGPTTGVLLVQGVAQLVITNMQFTVDAGQKIAEAVVGAQVRPDLFVDKIVVSGQFSGYFMDAVVSTLFLNEVDTAISMVYPNGQGAAADFVSFTMSKLNVNSATPDDVAGGLKRTYQFKAELNQLGGAGTATELTTFWVQDSLA